MKKRMILIMMACGFLCFAACGSPVGDSASGTSEKVPETVSGAESDADNGSQEEQTTLADVKTLTDANGDTIGLERTDEYQISGAYQCSGDGSAWTFYGDMLSIAYKAEDGTIGSYLCEIGFFEASADADGDSHLCIGVHNLINGESSFWYVMNVQDQGENTTGLELVLPGEPDTFILLTPKNISEESQSGDSR